MTGNGHSEISVSRKILVFHPGTQHSWQTAHALQETGRLAAYVTSIFYDPRRWPYKLEAVAPAGLAELLHKEFSRFEYTGLNRDLVVTLGIAEWLERLARRAGASSLAREIDRLGNRRFARRLSPYVRLPDVQGLWGYNGSALETFEAGKRLGKYNILDRTAADWRAFNEIMDEVYEEYREFFESAAYRVSQAQIDRDVREYALADAILVGSKFAAATIASFEDRSIAQKVRVMEYGIGGGLRFESITRTVESNRPVRFIYVGQVSAAKGVHLLLKVFSKLSHKAATLTIVGGMKMPRTAFSKYANDISYVPTVPRALVPSLLSKADVLILPSYFEGAGIVLYEAMAAGLAIIQSPNAASVATPSTGIMLSEVSERAVEEAVHFTLEDAQRLSSWKEQARMGALRYTFEAYAERVRTFVAELDAEGWRTSLTN
jgi:glycosyltransferase involved in cell wall biosynthesis